MAGYKTTNRDGNCLFNSIVCSLYWEINGQKLDKKSQYINAMNLRQKCVDKLESLFISDKMIQMLIHQEVIEDEDIHNVQDYFNRMRCYGIWGGNLEIIAISKLLDTSIDVYIQKNKKFKLIGGYSIENDNNQPIRLFYRGNNHYDFIPSNIPIK